MTVGVAPIRFSSLSAFAVAEAPTGRDLTLGGRVRFVVVSGVQDDALWRTRRRDVVFGGRAPRWLPREPVGAVGG